MSFTATRPKFRQPSRAPVVAGYVGPGDVGGWGSAYGYWGLRAYLASLIGTACIDICSNNNGAAANLQPINTASNGFIDTAALATYFGAHATVYVDKVYDQSGANQHLIYTVGSRPELKLGIIGGLPALFFDDAGVGAQYLSSAANATALTQAASGGITVSAVTKFAGTGEVFTDGSFSFQPLVSVFGNARSQQFGGSRVDYTGVDNTVEAIHSIANGVSSSTSINGTITSAGDPGSNGIAGTNKLTIGGTDAGSALFNGHIFEVLVKAGAVSTTNQGLLTANQRAIGTGF